MEREPGLYVTLLSDNRIKKLLTDENGEETESEVSIAEELLKYSDMLYEPSPKDLTEEEYSSWLQNATDARDKFLAGEMTEEDALAVIVVP